MDDPHEAPSRTPLNPALKSQTDTVYDTKTTTPAPIDTASASEGEGEGWPVIWLLITALCVAVTVYLVL